MTRTLLVHEFLRTRGTLAVIAGAATAFTVVGSLVAMLRLPVLSELGLVVGVLGASALVPVTLLALAIDYWRSAYGRQGYLTQTLPIRGSTIYRARLAYGMLVSVLALAWAVILGAAVYLAQAWRLGFSPWAQLQEAVREATRILPPWLVVAGIAMILLTLFSYLVHYYFAASIGSESRLAALGPGGPVLVWFGAYLLMQVVMVVAIVAVPFGLQATGGTVEIIHRDFAAAMFSSTPVGAMPLGFAPALLLITVAFAWRTAFSWERKVTLR